MLVYGPRCTDRHPCACVVHSQRECSDGTKAWGRGAQLPSPRRLRRLRCLMEAYGALATHKGRGSERSVLVRGGLEPVDKAVVGLAPTEIALSLRRRRTRSAVAIHAQCSHVTHRQRRWAVPRQRQPLRRQRQRGLLRLRRRLRLLQLLRMLAGKSFADLKHSEHRKTTRIKVLLSCKKTQVIQAQDLFSIEHCHDLIGQAWVHCSLVQQPLAQGRVVGRHVPTKNCWRRHRNG